MESIKIKRFIFLFDWWNGWVKRIEELAAPIKEISFLLISALLVMGCEPNLFLHSLNLFHQSSFLFFNKDKLNSYSFSLQLINQPRKTNETNEEMNWWNEFFRGDGLRPITHNKKRRRKRANPINQTPSLALIDGLLSLSIGWEERMNEIK